MVKKKQSKKEKLARIKKEQEALKSSQNTGKKRARKFFGNADDDVFS